MAKKLIELKGMRVFSQWLLENIGLKVDITMGTIHFVPLAWP